MKKNLRGKIREYIASEDGKVGVKSPLTLGVAAGGLLLAHTIIGTPKAEAQWCNPMGEGQPCPDGHDCRGPFVLVDGKVQGTCMPH